VAHQHLYQNEDTGSALSHAGEGEAPAGDDRAGPVETAGAGPPLLSIMQDHSITRTVALVDLARTGPAVEPDRGPGITLFEIMLLSATVAGRLCGHRTAPPGHTIRQDAGDQPAAGPGWCEEPGCKAERCRYVAGHEGEQRYPDRRRRSDAIAEKMAPLRMWGMWFS